MNERGLGARARLCWSALLVAVVAAVAFLPVAGFGFAYDDEWIILGNGHLDRDLATLLRACFSGRARAAGLPDATRPVMVASIWLDHLSFGQVARGYHLHSLVLYAACAASAFLAAYASLRRHWVALGAGLFFAVAPVHAEVVSAVNYREDLLSALSVLSLLAWITWPRRAPDSVDAAAVAGGVFALGLLSKANALVLLPLLGASWLSRGGSLARTMRARRLTLVSLGLVASGWGAWRGWLRLSGRDDVPLALHAPALWTRVLDFARYEAQSAADALWPFSWAPDHPPQPAASPVWLAALCVLCASATLAARRRPLRGAALALAWVLLAPIVTSPLVGPLNARADRYLFLSTLGAGCLWAVALRSLHGLACKVKLRWGVPVCAGLAVLVLAAHAQRAAAPWSSNATLWRAAVDRRPGSARGWTALSRQLRGEGDIDAADRALDQAIMLDPDLLRARVTAVYNALARGDVARAHELIDVVERMGGRGQLGMRRARQCAALAPDQAQRCVGLASPP